METLKLYLTFLLFLIPFYLNARNVRHYTISEGLSNNAVYSIAQDPKGRMWFGTIDGLHSFDGNRIQAWRDSEVSSLGSCIYTILADSIYLYVGSDQGLSVFDLQKGTFSNFEVQTVSGGKINSGISNITRDSKGNIWISTLGQGLFRYTPSTQILHPYPAIGKINSDVVYQLLEDHTGTLWVATGQEGISRYDPEQDFFQPVIHQKGIGFHTLFEDSNHNLWVGSSGSNGAGLFLLQNGQLIQKIKPFTTNSPLQIRKMAEWIPGFLLFASDEGLTEYNIHTGQIRNFRTDSKSPEGLNDNYLQTLFIDREGALWIGSYFGGVNYISPTGNNYTHYHNRNSQLDARIVSVFAQADNGNVWIGTDDSGFFYWNRQTDTFKHYHPQSEKPSPTYHNIHALLQDQDKLYVGMYTGGLDIMDLKSGKFKNYKAGNTFNSLYSSNIYALYKDKRDNLWIGTTLGLNLYKPSSDDFERIYETHLADISYVTEDTEGHLWVCSLNRGIFRLNSQTQQWEHFFHRIKGNMGSLPTNHIITACIDTKGEIWFGTDGEGLIRYNKKNGSFTKIQFPNPIRVVYKIIAERNNLWLTTSNGMYCYQPQNGTIKHYNKQDGLQENLFLPNSGIQLADGTILAGGIHGFNAFCPKHIVGNPQKPTVILTDFCLFNKPVTANSEDSPIQTSITYADHLILKPKHTIFSFSVNALSYTNPSKNRYRYKLEGFEEDWTETDASPKITYTNLPSGNYVFRVSASNSDGVWNENAIALPIKVLPPWYKSPLMILIYIIACLGSISYLFHRNNRIHHKNIQLLTAEKNKEIYQSKIEFFTHIMHEIRTPLTLILAPLENIMQSSGSVKDVLPQLQTIEKNGKRLLTLVNQLMDFRKAESGSMNLTLTETNITASLTNICQRFQLSAQLQHIEMITTLPDIPCYARIDKEAFNKIVSNLLSNALKFTENHIWINLLINDEKKVELRIKDNGQGITLQEQEKIFMPFYQISGNTPNAPIGTGVGLSLVKKLVDLMEGELKLESESGIGSTFIIRFNLAEQPEESEPENIPSLPISETEESSRIQRHILIVEDNPDLQTYLQSLFVENYKTSCASNGKEACNLLAQNMPDLVISDVMMPVMNGIELCRYIKQNITFSHIPVVLLTAKATTEDYVKGLENGADIYMEKPFSENILKAQINSLFRSREQNRKAFQNQPTTTSIPMPHSKLDVVFMDKIASIIEVRLTDSNFTVDILAQEIGISRSGLFAKIKSISGMTPNDYIRLIRLKKAATLLTKEDISSGEACFRVGFSSPSYFAKCFQAQFGVSPSEFKQKHP